MSTTGTPESQLVTLKAKALKAYSQKDYTTSTELYASACELQSSLHGENNPKNAHLLYLYGRSLFEVAVKKSDVLGGVKEEKEGKGKGKGKESKGRFDLPVSGSEAVIGEKALEKGAKGGLYQFTGDENWDDTDEDEDEDEEEGKAEEDDDDFALAWDILDYARVLFLKQLSPETTDAAAPPTTVDSSVDPVPNEDAATETASAPKLSDEEARSLRTALADTLDLLGEVSLESESFSQASKDFRSSLDLKLDLYTQESTIISEAHFKLSLSLEFAAAGEHVSDNDRVNGREDAAVEMEKAIASCRARIAKEEAEGAANGDDKGKGKEVVVKSLQDAKEMVEELEIRLRDLRTVETPIPEGPIKGILGQVLGEDQAVARQRIEEAISGARDLSGLVRKKTKEEVKEEVKEVKEVKATPIVSSAKFVVAGAESGSNGGKRKLDDLVEGCGKSEGESKKAKVEGCGKSEGESKKAKVEEVRAEVKEVKAEVK